MKRVLLTKELGRSLLTHFEGQAETITITEKDDAAFDEALPKCDALLLSTAFKMDRQRIENATRLKVISRTGVGVDNVDIDAASEAGMMVLNTPTANTQTVAEHTVALILALVKQIPWLDRETRLGRFDVRRLNVGHDLGGKVLGLLGCGRIGQEVAARMRAGFGMKVLGYDPYPQPVSGIVYVDSADELCQSADVVSLHMPLLDSTRNILDAKRLAMMKPGSFLINTARGGLIDEQELAKRLQDRHLAGAALDVFDTEPLSPDHPLAACENAVLTPHAAALTAECSQRVAEQAVQGIIDGLKGLRPEHIVNAKQLKNERL